MALNNPNQAYFINQVQTAAPGELTLMLYNGMLKFIRQAKLAVEQTDITKAHDLILRAQDVLTELQVTLKPDYEISQNLQLLYDYMKRRLIEANVNKDEAILTEVESMAAELRDTWSQALKSVK